MMPIVSASQGRGLRISQFNRYVQCKTYVRRNCKSAQHITSTVDDNQHPSRKLSVLQRIEGDARGWTVLHHDSTGNIKLSKEREAVLESGHKKRALGTPFSTYPIPPFSISTDVAKQWLTHAFLPAGYPESVRPHFLQYCKWQFLAIASGTVTGVLSMQALLFAIGLGAGSVPLAAAINWVLKDGLGQLGGVLYAANIGTRFDQDPKRHRFISTVVMQASTLLEVLTPLVPGLFLPLASVSNFGKNVSMLAASATRAQMHVSFGLRNNIGDITAKVTSQSIGASLVGTAVGILVSQITGESSVNVLAAFVPLSAVAIYSNFRSNLMVTVPTINRQRGEILFMHMLKTSCEEGLPSQLAEPLSPDEVANVEVFVRKYESQFNVDTIIDYDIGKLDSSQLDSEIVNQIFGQRAFLQEEKYYLGMIPDRRNRATLALWFNDTATSVDEIKGFFHVCALQILLQQHRKSKGPLEKDRLSELIKESHKFTIIHSDWAIDNLNNHGWHLETVQLSTNRSMVVIDSNGKPIS